MSVSLGEPSGEGINLRITCNRRCEKVERCWNFNKTEFSVLTSNFEIDLKNLTKGSSNL